MNTRDLEYLLSNYFPQDLYEIFGDESAAVDAFVSEAPDRAAKASRQIDQVVNSMSQSELERFVLASGCEYVPLNRAYGDWLRDVARRLPKP